MWRIWAKALGEKATPCNKESDKVALIRTLFIVQSVVANIFLIANAIHHW
jgi:flagellar biosynthesis protein FliP